MFLPNSLFLFKASPSDNNTVRNEIHFLIFQIYMSKMWPKWQSDSGQCVCAGFCGQIWVGVIKREGMPAGHRSSARDQKPSSSSGLSSIYQQIYQIYQQQDISRIPLLVLVPAGCCNFWSNYLQSWIVIGSYNEIVLWQGAWHNPWYKIESFLVRRSPVWKVYNLLWVLHHIYTEFPRGYCGRMFFNEIFHFEKPRSWTEAECLRNRFRSEQFDSP